MTPGAEVMIAGGGHQFQHGRVTSVDSKSFTIPFAHVQLRGIRGALLKNRWAFVPAKYLVEFDVEAMREQTMRAAAERVLKQLEAGHEA
jgi:hypothetical protein